jgi:hypothetical protein
MRVSSLSLKLLRVTMVLLLVPVTVLVICRTCSGVNRPISLLRHLVSSWTSLMCFCCLSRLSSVSAASRAAFASAGRCLSASVRYLVPVSRGVAESPCAVFCAVSGCTCVDGAVLAPGGFPSEELPAAAVSSTRGTCSSAGGALEPLLCELSILLYCTSISRSRRVSPPSYPWTLELRPCRTQLAWNAGKPVFLGRFR